jgi:carbon storage regulator
MLVLSRNKDESIIIGEGDDAVEVTIVDVRGDKVRLGINARRDISVHRKEVYEAIQREKAELNSNIVEDIVKFNKKRQKRSQE